MSPPAAVTVTVPVPAAAVAAAASHIRRLLSSSAENNDWAPFESKSDFNLDIALLLVFIVCFVLGAFLLNCIITRFLNKSTSDENRSKELKLEELAKSSGKTLEFSSGIKLAGTESVCTICLSEFVNGEGIRVLSKCNHGFHVKCIERWILSFHPSCPTCRTNCTNTSPETTKNPADFHGGDVDVESGMAELPIIIRAQQQSSTGSSSSSSSLSSSSSSSSE